MPGLGLARAGRREHARALDLDHADAADVGRLQRLAVAERRRLDAELAQRVEDRLALEHAHGLRRRPRARPCASARERLSCSCRHPPKTPRRPIADSMALDAVWPRPQIEASRMHWPISAIERELGADAAARAARRRAAPAPPAGARCRRGTGTHWPHDSLRKKAAMRISMRGRSTRVVEHQHDARAERRLRPRARPRTSAAGRARRAATKPPAAPPSSTACSAPPAGHAAGELEQLAQRRAERHLVDAGPLDVARRGRRASCRSTPSVPVSAKPGPARRARRRAR